MYKKAVEPELLLIPLLNTVCFSKQPQALWSSPFAMRPKPRERAGERDDDALSMQRNPAPQADSYVSQMMSGKALKIGPVS